MGDTFKGALRAMLGKDEPTEAEVVVAEVLEPVIEARFEPDQPAPTARKSEHRLAGRRSRMRTLLGAQTKDGYELIEILLAQARGQNGETARDRQKAAIALVELYYGKQVAVSGKVAHDHTGVVAHVPTTRADLSKLSHEDLMHLRALRLKAGVSEDPEPNEGK